MTEKKDKGPEANTVESGQPSTTGESVPPQTSIQKSVNKEAAVDKAKQDATTVSTDDNTQDHGQKNAQNKTNKDTVTTDTQPETQDAIQNASDTDRPSSDELLDKLEARLAEEAELEKNVGTEKDAKTQEAKSEKSTQAPYSDPVGSQVVIKRSFNWLGLFAFLIALGAAAGVGFLYWQGQMWLTTNAQVDALKEQQIANQQQSMAQLQIRITDLQSKISRQDTAIVSYRRTLAELTQRTKELGQSQPNQWLAAEALYLVNLAERRLLVEQDVETAIQLLVSANVRLTAMKDPSVFPIRQAISEDIAALNAVVYPDSDSLYLALGGLIQQVQTLPFAHYYLPQPEPLEQEASVSDDISDWRKNIEISVARFLNFFIRVKHHNHSAKPALPVDQQWFVRANITTQLLMAQQAILEQNEVIYKESIAQAKMWIAQYLNVDEDAVVAAANTLGSLEARQVALKLPAELVSQATLTNYVNAQRQLQQGSSGATERRDLVRDGDTSNNEEPGHD